ncbi:MAG: S8 family serine peptidase [Erythrobacter sp.]
MSNTNTDKFRGRIRSVLKCTPQVNAAKAEFDGSIRLVEGRGIPKVKDLPQRSSFTHSDSVKDNAPALQKLKKDTHAPAEREIEASVFALLRDSKDKLTGVSNVKQRGRVCTIKGSLKEISALADDPRIASIQMADTIRPPVAQDDGLVESTANRSFVGDAIKALNLEHGNGEGVLIGIIDDGGFDFAHPDFLKDTDGTTRFVRIWDQAQDDGFRDPPQGFDYGAEITDTHLNAAIQEAANGGLPPHELEPQSRMIPGSHATHVASIAAGNSGVCNKAMIAGVQISLTPEDHDRRRSFYDSARLAHAVEYLVNLADELGAKALSINISLGTNGGPHDDSAPIARWFDAALTEPGRTICVSAGNAGQEAQQHSQDIGFTTGRIHTAGTIAAAGLEQRIEMVVVGSGIEDISENELEIWYQPQDRIAVEIKPPGGEWSRRVQPNEFIRHEKLADGTFISVFNELYDPSNGANKISIYLTPFLGDTIVGVTPGVWTIKLIGEDIRDGRYDGWIERDDPREVFRSQGSAYWQFPSFFTEASNVDDSSVNSLACGARIIGVANYDEATGKVNITSSQGPTRDEREKPDIAAPGTAILAANGFDDEALWTQKTGTSMSSPYVAGLVGLMHSAAAGAGQGNSELTAAQIIGMLRRTALPLPGHSYDWRNDAGFGAVQAGAAIREALASGPSQEVGG